jgi:hypothetical protein
MLLLLPFALYETRTISKQISRQELFLFCVTLFGVILFVKGVSASNKPGLLATSGRQMPDFWHLSAMFLTPFIAWILLHSASRSATYHCLSWLDDRRAWLLPAANGTFERN